MSPVKIVRSAAVLTIGAMALAGCGSDDDQRTARLEAEVAVLKTAATSTTSTTAAPTTTTTVPTTTATTAKLVVATPTTTKPVATTTTTVAPWCQVRALASPVTRGMTQTIYVTSNLPGRKAVLGHQEVAMDASGSAQYSVPGTGGYMDQYGNFTPKTVTATVPFYTQPWTLDMVVDKPRPPLLTSCFTTYLAIGPS